MAVNAYKIHIKGLVQGVGFRPFVYRLARQNNLKGWVENRNDGVTIKIEAGEKKLENFLQQLRQEAPVASSIQHMNIKKSDAEFFKEFSIVKSKNLSRATTDISPDIAVCNNCLTDMKQQEHRYSYPFINCTNCGPRFSIIRGLPYDRAKTTMDEFRMCEKCAKEYSDVEDRRFHAQPVACNYCGPHYELHTANEKIRGIDQILKRIQLLLGQGEIIAVKGIGGFHLMCDAFNDEAIQLLRKRKIRSQKPFAVMFRDIHSLSEYVDVTDDERDILTSWRRPIVLLKQHKELSVLLNPGMNRLGVMLPYMPFHHLLFERLQIPAVVMTSGNYSDTPIVADNLEAYDHFKSLADAFLIYNRDIYNRLDDSVVKVVDNHAQMIRRSRGYVPEPVYTAINAEGILATGAELKNCFAVGKDNRAIMSQHIGDLKNYETYSFYSEMVNRFLELFRVKPQIIVSDMHPEYLSTRFAAEYQKNSIQRQNVEQQGPVGWIKVQHHHAHIASAMAENVLDERVIGVSLDGTGYGDDKNIWGGEFLICDLNEYSRYAHFSYVPMPGGDKAAFEPWRMAVSYLYDAYGNDFVTLPLEILKGKSKDEVTLIQSMIQKNLNSPLTSSAGRLFDAVSALLNLCDVSSYDAEAPMKLEAIVDPACDESYEFGMNDCISFRKTVKGIVDDLIAGRATSEVAAKFHNTVVESVTQMVKRIHKEKNLRKVVLSGGTFQNSYLLKNIINKLQKANLEVYTNQKVPCNDGGIALGQMAVAAKRRALKCV
jgi:hydrogenase maturation protein HypF